MPVTARTTRRARLFRNGANQAVRIPRELELPGDEVFIRAEKGTLILEAKGTPIGPNDLLIASQARALGMTVVTDNLSEFRRVPGLDVVNWLRE